MCNLYTVRKSAVEVAAHLGVPNPMASNAPEEVYPGTPGMVVTEAVRELRSMVLGFLLRLKDMKPEAKSKPVNNIADLGEGCGRLGPQTAGTVPDPAEAFWPKPKGRRDA
ncbi:hypothetical protein [Rhizobium populisoli]|uniref:hypothetical protein n=1 Tax=Rhizobium populisoli TaxID=2859785 RepID=UPI001FECE30C|nr:hypothetical protein [Rhizobium populisoli]